MKTFLFFLLLSLGALHCLIAQSYLGYTSHAVELVDTNYQSLKHIPKGDAVFLISLESSAGYYNVIHIKSNKEGFIPRKSVMIERVVPQIEENVFTSVVTSDVKYPVIKVHNASRMVMTLKFNNVLYELQPKEKKTINLQRGRYYYRVSAPSVEPYYGTEELHEFRLYEWEFYIGDM